MAKDTPQPAPDDVDDQPTAVGATAAAADANADVPRMSYEAARDELVDIVARLENGQVGLEDSMGLWQRGEPGRALRPWLDDAEATLSD